MNEVYLRGKLVSVYEAEGPASQPKHLVYQLRVSHKTAQQQVKFENYTVNAWRNLAVWASANLQVGIFPRMNMMIRLAQSMVCWHDLSTAILMQHLR